MATRPLSKPELLSPAGDWQALRAAVANGADAVYFGLPGFSARHRAANFGVDELPEVMRFLHAHNVRGYLAFNTLAFSDELPRAAEVLRAAAKAGVDALIVQDLGLVKLVRQLIPDMPVHASTQMTLMEPVGIEFVRRLGVERVILARELSIQEIARIAKATDARIEVFVHGALCISYSGQCLTSESVGGRSANRGQCAQACRLPYTLIVDGRPLDQSAAPYVLSPKDLAVVGAVPELLGLGVTAFKIEGRLKNAIYVAAATRLYRSALSAAIEGTRFEVSRRGWDELAMTFSRGFTSGFLMGPDHQALVDGRSPKSRGIRIGAVTSTTSTGIVVVLDQGIPGTPSTGDGDESRHLEGLPSHSRPASRRVPFEDIVKPGDGIVLDGGHGGSEEQGGRVFAVTLRQDYAHPGGKCGRPRPGPVPCPTVHIQFRKGSVNLKTIEPGMVVWKTDDPAIRRRLEQTYARDTVVHRIPLDVSVDARIGGRLSIRAREPGGLVAEAVWDQPLVRAEQHPLSPALVEEHFSRLGDTPFALASVRADAIDPVMVPKSVLNRLRREVIDRLIHLRQEGACGRGVDDTALDRIRAGIRERWERSKLCRNDSPADPGPSLAADGAGGSLTGLDPPAAKEHLSVLVRSMDQLHAVVDWSPPPPIQRPSLVYCEFRDVREYPRAVSLGQSTGVPVGLATLRVIKPGQGGFLRQIARCDPSAVLIRNLAGVVFFQTHGQGIVRVGDYSLNVANEISADLLLSCGLDRVVPGYDLTWEQMSAMLARVPPAQFEIVIHQHMPMFHTQHCLIASLLTQGRDRRSCGQRCTRRRVALRDRTGVDNPVTTDLGCRTTVYNAVAQSAVEYLPRMMQAGVRHFRIELLLEDAAQARRLLDAYGRVLGGQATVHETWRALKSAAPAGLTRGTWDDR